MQIAKLTATLLLSLSALLGVRNSPQVDLNGGDWTITQNWRQADGVSSIEVQSSKIVQQCSQNEFSTIQFPTIIHGAHDVLLDGTKIGEFGDRKFQSVWSFYGSPEVPCSMVRGGKILTWRGYSYSEYFARFSHFPGLVSHSKLNLFNETFNLIAAGCLAIMALLSAVLFFGRVPNELMASITLGSLGFALYFFGSTAGYFQITGSMLTIHKIADFSVWMGLALFYNSLRLTRYLSERFYWIYFFNIVVGLFFIILGSTGDVVQFGTTLPFAGTILVNIACEIELVRRYIREGFDRRALFVFLSLTIFLVADVNEIFVVTGLLPSYTIFNLGAVGGLLFFALYVNERITQTYRERDYLQANLELEVKLKTSELKKKSEDLETTLKELKTTQADLVQAAKLASLGTLSAGIAHEINNSLNYVYGSLKPLETLVLSGVTSEARAKATKLFKIMNEGLLLTFDIIKSLRNYSGLNQAKLNDLKLIEVMSSVETILRPRLRDSIQVIHEVDPNLSVFGSVVGLHQVFMNLISNAIDAMPNGGQLHISAHAEGEQVKIKIRDTGTGMPDQVLQRIFEPFFTTKEVGKGTGLGLHIVKTEVERQGGSISVQSQVGIETEFTLVLPIHGASERLPDAA